MHDEVKRQMWVAEPGEKLLTLDGQMFKCNMLLQWNHFFYILILCVNVNFQQQMLMKCQNKNVQNMGKVYDIVMQQHSWCFKLVPSVS